MVFMDSLPSWDAVVSQAGVGKDPFLSLLGTIERIVYPTPPNSIFGILLGFSAVYFVLALVCLGLLLIPVLRGREARKRHYWLLKKQHLPSTTTPYYIFNSGLVMILSQLAASILFEVYIFLSFQSLKSPGFSRKVYLNVCLELCWLPGYFGFHVTAFGSLYTYLSSPRRTSSQLPACLRPTFLNILFFAIPILVTLQTLGWCIALFINARSQSNAYLAFVGQALADSEDWRASSVTTTDGGRLVLARLAQFLRVCDEHVLLARWSSACWAIIGVLLTITYAIAVTALITLLKSCMALSGGRRSFTRTLEYHTEVDGFPTCETKLEAITITTTQPSAKRMQTGYLYLVGHCSIMLLCLLLDVPIGILMAVETEQAIFNAKWRAVANWITLVGSCFVSVAMLIHSWRILTERDTTQTIASSTNKPVYEQEVTPARFIVEREDEDEFREAHKTLVEMGQSPTHTTFPSGLKLGLEIRSER